MLKAHPGRHGAKALAGALKALTPEDPRTRSKLEQRFLKLIRRAGLPEPQCNVYVDGLLVDFYWPDADLVVEVDSFAHHRGRPSFEEDRRRDSIHTVAGRRTLRRPAAGSSGKPNLSSTTSDGCWTPHPLLAHPPRPHRAPTAPYRLLASPPTARGGASSGQTGPA